MMETISWFSVGRKLSAEASPCCLICRTSLEHLHLMFPKTRAFINDQKVNYQIYVSLSGSAQKLTLTFSTLTSNLSYPPTVAMKLINSELLQR
jgi:hypothetical protein